MGIPSYFRFILEEYNDKDELILSKIERNNKTINIDYLCIDFNSIIYTVYAKKKQEIDKIATSRIEIMNLLIEKIVEEMKYIIDFIGPRKKHFLPLMVLLLLPKYINKDQEDISQFCMIVL